MKIASFAFAVFFASGPAFAATYFVRPATGALPADEAASVQELVAGAVGKAPNSKVVAEEKDADFVLTPKVLKLGQALILRVSKTSKDGTVIAQEQGRASSIEDMDTVAARVARAVVTSVEFKGDARVDDVTEDEVTRGQRRIRSVQTRYFGFGPAGAWNLQAKGVGVNLELGRSWAIDSHFSMNLGLRGLFFTDSPAGAIGADTTIEYALSDRSASPYLTAGPGLVATTAHSPANEPIKDSVASGFAGVVGAGVKMFRTSDVNVGIGVKYWFVFKQNSLGNPSSVLGTMTLHF